MSAPHTPEPWFFNPHRSSITQQDPTEAPDSSKKLICLLYQGNGIKYEDADAKRIVACINACAGLNPEAVPELVAACTAQHEAIDRLFAMLIEAKKDFFPNRSGQPWEALQLGAKALSNSAL